MRWDITSKSSGYCGIVTTLCCTLLGSATGCVEDRCADSNRNLLDDTAPYPNGCGDSAQVVLSPTRVALNHLPAPDAGVVTGEPDVIDGGSDTQSGSVATMSLLATTEQRIPLQAAHFHVFECGPDDRVSPSGAIALRPTGATCQAVSDLHLRCRTDANGVATFKVALIDNRRTETGVCASANVPSMAVASPDAEVFLDAGAGTAEPPPGAGVSGAQASRVSTGAESNALARATVVTMSNVAVVDDLVLSFSGRLFEGDPCNENEGSDCQEWVSPSHLHCVSDTGLLQCPAGDATSLARGAVSAGLAGPATSDGGRPFIPAGVHRNVRFAIRNQGSGDVWLAHGRGCDAGRAREVNVVVAPDASSTGDVLVCAEPAGGEAELTVTLDGRLLSKRAKIIARPLQLAVVVSSSSISSTDPGDAGAAEASTPRVLAVVLHSPCGGDADNRGQVEVCAGTVCQTLSEESSTTLDAGSARRFFASGAFGSECTLEIGQ